MTGPPRAQQYATVVRNALVPKGPSSSTGSSPFAQNSDRGFIDHQKNMVSEHFDYPKRPTKSGTVLLAGRTMKTDNSNFGIVIFLLSSIEEARGIMNADASVASRVFRAELFPYRNVLMNIDSKRWEP